MQWLNAVGHDVRNSWRLALKSPVLSVATVVTLAVGIGLDAGVFTLLDGMLFRARVNDAPETFAQISVEYSVAGMPHAVGLPFANLQDYRAYRDGARSFRDIAAWTPARASLGTSANGDGDASTDIVPMLVTCNFFEVYDRTPPLMGRVFDSRDCVTPGREPVAVVTEDLWRTRYAADPKIVGSTILVNRKPFAVIGVMPSGYSGQLRGGLWIPYSMEPVFFAGRDLFREPALPWLIVVGRLPSPSARSAALAELAVIASQQDRLVPGRKTTVRLTNGSLIEESYMRPMAAWIVPIVMGSLSLVFLMACANVAMLTLSRAASRRREMAVRLALGANRTILLRLLLIENLMLAAVATPLSAYLTYQVPIVFRKMNPVLPFYPFHVDVVVFAYLAGLTVLAGLLSGITPALESLKSDVSASLHGREARLGPSGKWRPRDVLIAAQVGMSLVLMVAVGLFVRSEYRLITADPGFETSHVLVSTPRISVPPYTPQSAAAFYETLTTRLRAVAGVREVGYASVPPIGGSDAGSPRAVMTLPGQPADRAQTAPVNVVSPSFFATVSIPIVRGRLFHEADADSGVTPVIVSESLARAMWPDGDAVGAVARADDRVIEVAGIARDVQPLIPGAGASMLYELRRPQSIGDALLIRFDGDARSTARVVRATVAALDGDAVADALTVEEIRDGISTRFMRLIRIVLFLGAVGVALAAVGIYGVVAFAAASRTRELGIRMALGATKPDIVRLVLSWGAKPIAAGLVGGAIGTALFAQAVLQLFRNGPVILEPRDPLMYGAVTILLIVTAIAAMLGPARRAASADPVHALRQD